MILLFDIGNTHTHLGLADSARVVKQANIPTAALVKGEGASAGRGFAGRAQVWKARLCAASCRAPRRLLAGLAKRRWRLPCLELTPATLRGVGIDYPRPRTIGPDRLANAVAARHHFGAPAVVVDFGTAVTFDVVDRAGNYVGGIIAPGTGGDDRLPAREDRPAAAHPHPRSQRARSARAPSKRCWSAPCMAIAVWFAN